jgi:FlaA1/EpsC-like NDP-sugar epimerase
MRVSLQLGRDYISELACQCNRNMRTTVQTNSTLPPTGVTGPSDRSFKFLPSRLAPVGWVRSVILLFSFSGILFTAHHLAWQLRFDFDVPDEFRTQINRNWLWVIGLKIAYLFIFGQFSGLLSYFSVPDLRRLFFACFAGSGTLLFIRYTFGTAYAAPRGVILADFILSIVGLSMLRLSFRVLRERYFAPQGRSHRRMRRVGIIGAGDVGATLVRELQSKRGLGLLPVAFFDDDKGKWRSRVHDIPVVGPPEALREGKLNLQLEEVIIAMPNASARRISEVIKLLQLSHLRFETVPSIDQLATGQVKVSQLRNVEVEDLLGREPVELEAENIRQLLAGRIVMVTGAGGSIGSELCRQIILFNPQRLLLVDQSEFNTFQIEQDLIDRGFSGTVLPLVADILDEQRMRYIFGRFGPDIIFHAAAHKHVPMMEQQPGEALRNNSFGTALLAELAAEFRVKYFVLISTDKAINPTNVMGASKRLAELFLQAYAAENGKPTRFIAVRFGNVLGSSGSVIPIFKKQIAAGGPVRVTHPEVTRYFMTIPEAAGLVLQAASQGTGGEIFVLDMGKAVKIVDLARQLIELSGLKAAEDIEIEFTGLRPGEKLFEELSHKGENIAPTDHRKILRFISQPQSLTEVRAIMEEIRQELYCADPARLKLLLKKAIPEYQPYLT